MKKFLARRRTAVTPQPLLDAESRKNIFAKVFPTARHYNYDDALQELIKILEEQQRRRAAEGPKSR